MPGGKVVRASRSLCPGRWLLSGFAWLTPTYVVMAGKFIGWR